MKKLKFLREMSDDEKQEFLGQMFQMKAYLERMVPGCKIFISGSIEVEIDPAENRPGEGNCPKCNKPTVTVAWKQPYLSTEIAFAGLACQNCKRILEYAGYAPLSDQDLEKLIKGKSK